MRVHHIIEGEVMPSYTEVALLLGHISSTSTEAYLAMSSEDK